MFKKNTLIHLRIPFSLYLMPFFCFALSQANQVNVFNLILSFIIIHLFFNPASNAFNSYYDKDESSIGGIENPPPVDKEVLYVALIFDFIGLGLSLLISWEFFALILGIGLMSKAYSHPSIRLKKFPILGLLTVSIFQGGYTYFMSIIAIEGVSFDELISIKNFYAAGLCSLLLLGSYPMTQVYQHHEDGKRGDLTISRLLGIRGTFYWTIGIFTLGTGAFFYYLMNYFHFEMALIYMVFMGPTLLYFLYWFGNVLIDETAANYKSTMNLNKISALSFISYFILLYFYRG